MVASPTRADTRARTIAGARTMRCPNDAALLQSASIPTVPVPDVCPPSLSRMHARHPCPGCMPTVRVPDAYPPSVSRMHTHDPIPRVAPWAGMRRSFRAHPYPPPVSRMHARHSCPGCIPTVRVPDAYPRPYPQGCTLGWYALPLWGTWNPVLMAAQPRWLLECDCGMARSVARSSPNGATCVNLGRRPGTHVTTQGNALGFM